MKTTQNGVLTQILREAHQFKSQNRPFLAVFDLDSTLFDLTLRVATIVDAFAQDRENQRRFPKECEHLAKIEIRRTDWGIGEALARIGLSPVDSPEFHHELHRHWAAYFFSDHYLHHDEPLSGAVEYVRELYSSGAHIMYLTGRDVPRMWKGTHASLMKTGFPLNPPQASLVLKPEAGQDDAEFKVGVLKSAEKSYEKIWLFENEPVNLNRVAQESPDIGLVFIDSTHSGREQVSETLDRITHFETDLDELKRYRQD